MNPTADFDFICNAEECTFTDRAAPTPTARSRRYAWDFGDTETSTEADPVHTYAGVTELTDFDVTLTVTDDDGGTGTVTKKSPWLRRRDRCDDGLANLVACGLRDDQRRDGRGRCHQPRLHG